METDKLIRLLVIQESQNEAELLVSLLRNAGIPVRPFSAQTEEEAVTLLEERAVDLVLCSVAMPDLGIAPMVQQIRRLEKDVPLLAVAPCPDPDLHAQVMHSGARDLVSFEQPEHLRLVVERELEDLERRRQLRLCERRIRESERRCHALLDSARDAITYVHEGMHIHANRSYLELFGFESADEVEGTPIMDVIAPEDHPRFKEFLRRCRDGQSSGELEIMGLRPEGGTIELTLEFSPASMEGEACTQIVIRDRSPARDLVQRLEEIQVRDLVTGLSNRQHFLRILDEALAETQDNHRNSSVVTFAPDAFEDLAHAVGPAATDTILRETADVVRSHIGEDDVASRFGEHSFAILLRDRGGAEAVRLAEQIRTAVENHVYDLGERSATLTVSVGIAVVGETVSSPRDALTHAQQAQARAAAAGGNRVEVHEVHSEATSTAEQRHLWAERVRAALAGDGFVLVFQPIASLHGEPGEKYEVLLRYEDSEGGLCSPAEFLEAVEAEGLGAEIDRWVLHHAIRALARRRAEGRATVFFAKLSASSLRDAELPGWLAGELRGANLAPGHLVLEISEAAAVTHLKHAKDLVAALRGLGCRIALEHFGAGVNSFQLLKHVPADFLKIDASFMNDLARDQENQAMVKSLTETAHRLGKATIAHFVEDASSLSILWQCGVNYIQGNFLQEPDVTMGYDFEEGPE